MDLGLVFLTHTLGVVFFFLFLLSKDRASSITLLNKKEILL